MYDGFEAVRFRINTARNKVREGGPNTRIYAKIIKFGCFMPVNYFLHEEFGFLWLFHRSVVFYAWQNPKNSSVFKKLKRSPENRHRGDGSISGLKNKVFKSDEIDPVLGGCISPPIVIATKIGK